MTEYTNTVKNLIAEKAGVDVEEIKEDSFFEEDLNIGEMDLIEILTDLEDIYETEMLDEKDNIHTVGDILDILLEKLE